jgi:hypothetical protein
MPLPWEQIGQVGPVGAPPIALPPWEQPKPPRKTLADPITGLFPGQKHPLDIPDFLRR